MTHSIILYLPYEMYIKIYVSTQVGEQMHIHTYVGIQMGFPGGSSGKELTYQYRRCKRRRFNPQVRKIPWRRAWQPTPVFSPRESHGQRSLVGYSPQGRKESDMTEVTQRACTQAGVLWHLNMLAGVFTHGVQNPLWCRTDMGMGREGDRPGLGWLCPHCHVLALKL